MRVSAFFAVGLAFVASWSAEGLGWSATISVPPLEQKTYTKATVTWPTLAGNNSFALTCGQSTNVCATVTPGRLAPKFSWIDPPGFLQISAATDPSCNGGQGGFLTIMAPSNLCIPGQESVVATL